MCVLLPAALVAPGAYALPVAKPDCLSTGQFGALPGPKKRIMILMSDTGGGHRASADAIKAGFHILYGDKFEVRHLGRGQSKLAACQQPATLPLSTSRGQAACPPQQSAED